MAKTLFFRLVAVFFACTFIASSGAAAQKQTLPKHNIDVNAVDTGNFSDLKPGEIKPGGNFTVIGFNIKYGDSGFKGIVEYISAQLEKSEALIVCLSEVDRNHSRSGDMDVIVELAKALKMNYAFGVEFVDFTDTTPEKQGVSGNAILTRLPISNASAVHHTVVFDWSKTGMFNDTPRDGGRSALLADVEVAPGRKVRIVSAHLENRSNAAGRAAQMDEIINAVKDVKEPVVIAGDMNDQGGTLMFDNLKKAGFENAFEKDTAATGGCHETPDEAEKVMCVIKLDWILYRGAALETAAVDGVTDSQGKAMSDHKPVRAVFRF